MTKTEQVVDKITNIIEVDFQSQLFLQVLQSDDEIDLCTEWNVAVQNGSAAQPCVRICLDKARLVKSADKRWIEQLVRFELDYSDASKNAWRKHERYKEALCRALDKHQAPNDLWLQLEFVEAAANNIFYRIDIG